MIASRFIAVVLLGLILGGCSGSGEDELQQWMTDQRNQTKPQIAPIPAPKKFQPQVYVQEVGADPFSVGRLVQALRQESGSATSNAALVAPELSRRKEPLESMPLDSMKMVGSLDRGGHGVAIVRVDNLLYQVKPGH